MLTFFFVKLKYFWFSWCLNKKESYKMSVLKSRLASNFFFFCFVLFVFLCFDRLFKTKIYIGIGLFISLFGENAISRAFMIISITFVYFIIKYISRAIFVNYKSRYKRQFDSYVAGDKVLIKSDRFKITLFLASIILFPILIVVFFWLKIFFGL